MPASVVLQFARLAGTHAVAVDISAERLQKAKDLYPGLATLQLQPGVPVVDAWNATGTELPEVAKFKSEMQVLPYAWLILSNLLAIIVTLGLAYPWTKIRKAAYLASVTTVAVYPAIDNLIEEAQQNSNAFGEEAAGLFDVDVSLA